MRLITGYMLIPCVVRLFCDTSDDGVWVFCECEFMTCFSFCLLYVRWGICGLVTLLCWCHDNLAHVGLTLEAPWRSLSPNLEHVNRSQSQTTRFLFFSVPQKKESYTDLDFGTTWGWVNDNRNFIYLMIVSKQVPTTPTCHYSEKLVNANTNHAKMPSILNSNK